MKRLTLPIPIFLIIWVKTIWPFTAALPRIGCEQGIIASKACRHFILKEAAFLLFGGVIFGLSHRWAAFWI